MSLEANKVLVRRFVEEVQSQHKLTTVDEIMDPNMIDHAAQPSSLNSVETFKKFFSGMLIAFPDIKVDIHNQVAEGDKVVTHKTFHGTHKGEFMGIPPTGKKVALEVIDIFRIAGGKFAEHWAVIDMMSMMQQLGVIPPMGKR
ncbi:MAG: ester cyclase [Candidatus Bathyarchaeia archaeon]|jgi:steroid delta-isomerase-like uncharacterized protein